MDFERKPSGGRLSVIYTDCFQFMRFVDALAKSSQGTLEKTTLK